MIVARKRRLRQWAEKARKSGTCSVYKCNQEGFPYCRKHDAP